MWIFKKCTKQLLKCKLHEDGGLVLFSCTLVPWVLPGTEQKLQKYSLNEEENYVNKYINSDKGLESDEIRMEMRGLHLDRLVGERAFWELTFEGDGNGKEMAMWVLRAVFQIFICSRNMEKVSRATADKERERVRRWGQGQRQDQIKYHRPGLRGLHST